MSVVYVFPLSEGNDGAVPIMELVLFVPIILDQMEFGKHIGLSLAIMYWLCSFLYRFICFVRWSPELIYTI